MNHDHAQGPPGGGSAPASPHGWIFWAFFAIAAVFLALEHRAHLLGVLPYLLLLACPLLHLFMHRGHGPGRDRA